MRWRPFVPPKKSSFHVSRDHGTTGSPIREGGHGLGRFKLAVGNELQFGDDGHVIAGIACFTHHTRVDHAGVVGCVDSIDAATGRLGLGLLVERTGHRNALGPRDAVEGVVEPRVGHELVLGPAKVVAVTHVEVATPDRCAIPCLQRACDRPYLEILVVKSGIRPLVMPAENAHIRASRRANHRLDRITNLYVRFGLAKMRTQYLVDRGASRG